MAELLPEGFDFLSDFDGAAALTADLSEVRPAHSTYAQDPHKSETGHISRSDRSSVSTEDKAATSTRLREGRKESAADRNRRNQRTYKLRQQAKWQQLQQQLADSTATIQRLEAEVKQLNHHKTHPELAVSSKLTLANSIFYCCATADTNKWTSTVHHTEEVVSMYQARRMTPQQLALIWQDYMRECAICIATGGPELRHDLHSEAGRRLLQLEAELRTLFTTLGAVDFKTYSQFMTNSVLPVQQSQQSVESALKQLNWLKLAHGLHFTKQQKSNIFLLRRAFLHTQALLIRQKQELQHQSDAASGSITSSDESPDEVAWQLHDLDRQLQEAYVAYKGVIYDGVCTTWQGIMILISVFPHPPHAFTYLTDALADEAGEPSAADMQATTKHISPAYEMHCSLAHVQSHIYKTSSRALEMQQLC